MVSQLEAQLGIDLPSTMMFDYPTTSAISAAVSSMLGAARRPGSESQAIQLSTRVDDAVKEVLGSILGNVPSDGTPLMMAGMTSRCYFLMKALSLASLLSIVSRSAALHRQQCLVSASLPFRDATEMVSKLEQSLGIELPSTLMFDFPTAAALTVEVRSLLEKQHRPNMDSCDAKHSVVPPHSAIELQRRSGECCDHEMMMWLSLVSVLLAAFSAQLLRRRNDDVQ
jgi:acyl carrier protein